MMRVVFCYDPLKFAFPAFGSMHMHQNTSVLYASESSVCIKVVGSCKQQDGGHGSRNLLRILKDDLLRTPLPNMF